MGLLEDPKIQEKFLNQDLNVLKLAIARRSTDIVLKALQSPAVIKATNKNIKDYLRAADLSGRKDYLEAILDVLPEDKREESLAQFMKSKGPKREVAPVAPANQKNANGKRSDPG